MSAPEVGASLPTLADITAALDEVRWSVAMDCLHHEKLTEHGRWVLENASAVLRTIGSEK